MTSALHRDDHIAYGHKMITNVRVIEFRFNVMRGFGVANLLGLSAEKLPVGGKLDVFPALGKRSIRWLIGILRKPRHNGVTSKKRVVDLAAVSN